jgi:hypothetical protein
MASKSGKSATNRPAKRRRSGCGVVALVLLAIVVTGGAWLWRRIGVGGAGIPIQIGQAQLQQGLQQAFPIDKRELFLTVHLSDPTVQLDPADGDRIGFGARVGASIAGKKIANGTVNATGKLRYEPLTGTFYLDQPQIKKLDIDRISGAESGPIRKAISYVLNKAVRHLPVYQLDRNDPMQRVARQGLRSVRVTDGAVEVRLGLNP